MKKNLLFWVLVFMLGINQVLAQGRTISGTVTDADDGEPLIGVSVLVKGTAQGAVTDIDGNYSIKDVAQSATTLVFSYVGYPSQEVAIGTNPTINVKLQSGIELDETVVTAVAIKREKRSTSYSTNTVKSGDLNEGTTNLFSALQAKTPGVRINSAGGAVGSSNRIVLDGEASFLLGNNALIVIDGIPVNNNTANGNLNDLQNFVDFGNRANDFDPDNIESMTVLKGPAATALYGSRASSGVIMITTKSGSSLAGEGRKFHVTLNSGLTVDRAYLQMKKQERFGQGYDLAPDPIENFSWGPEFDGVVRPWTPVVIDPETGIPSQLIRPYSAVKNQLQNAFNTGITTRNGLQVEGGDEKYGYFLSYINTDNKGIFDNTFYKRHALTGNMNVKFSDKLSSRVNVQYSNVNQRVILGAGTSNFGGTYQALLQQAANIPINELRDYNNLYQGFAGYYGGYTANPYFLMNNSNNDNHVDNLLASAELTYTPIENLNFTARVGDNITISNTTQEKPWYEYTNPTKANNDKYFGSYAESVERRNNLTIDLIASYQKEFSNKIGLTALAGYNTNSIAIRSMAAQTENGLTVPGFYNLDNSVALPTVAQGISNYRLIGAYGQIGLSYNNLLFAEYTARNDWSSTLPEDSRGFFYQSAGLSFIPTEFIKGSARNWIGYAKLRFNAGTQGKDATPYLLASTNSVNPIFDDFFDGNLPLNFPIQALDGNDVNGITINNRIGNPNLKPEITIAYEAGVDLDILKNYVHVEYSFRHRTHKDLIIIASLPASTGFTSQVVNVGKMRNISNELLARVTAVKNKRGVNWDFRLQFSKTNNKVLKANTDSKELNIGTYINPGLAAVEGLPFGTFKVDDYERTADGKIIVGPGGLPTLSTEFVYAGSFLPKYTMGWGSTLSWKGLVFDIQFDMKKGGVFYSETKRATDFNGTSLSSLLNDRQPYIIPNSVIDNGDGTYSENTVPATNIYDIVSNIAPNKVNMLDASYIKLREVSLSYTFGDRFFKNTPLTSISLGVVARNLMFWLPKENTFADPESNSYGQAGNEQGIEAGSYPTTRSVGVDLKIKF
ncbi:MAG: SusC/RagA family TonB-linked outer membrane protein [Chitinophagales bacterium]|nr:SusC/RagA family TonB-linked outer membrane protein [Chitinophagales bacterium]